VGKQIMSYLIRFRYEAWCQGPEWTTETILVNNVASYDAACRCVKMTFDNAKDFENLTYSPIAPFVSETSSHKLVKQP